MGMPNFENRTLFKGDNLPFLQGLNSESVDLIATDPPFNKGRDFHATPDSLAAGAKFHDRWTWERDTHEEWIDAIADYGDKTVHHFIRMLRENGKEDLAAFLCFLGVRMMECHRILKPTGSLYLHIDSTAHAYAKVLMDGIFGRDNFRNEIAWCYDKWTNAAAYFQRNHDSILFYTKGDNYTFNKVYHITPRKQKSVDRGWETNTVQGGKRQIMVYDWAKAKAQIASKPEGHYHRVIDMNERPQGSAVPDWWENIPYLNSQAKERTGYPTQKPLKLYERIIEASSNPGDFVLDPFCGCATTPVAAENLGRKWIGMDLWDGCHDIIIERLNQGQQIWQPGQVRLVIDPLELERTDDAATAAPLLPNIERRRNRRPRFSRQEMFDILLRQWGEICWGCGFEPPHTDFFDLDHIHPKSEGGQDELDNRAILCGPCNREKSNRLTLTQLRAKNKREGRWYARNPDIEARIPVRLAVEGAREYLRKAAQQGAGGGGADD